MSAKNAIFDDYDYAANNLTIHQLDMYSRTPKSLQLEGLATEDGAVQVTSRYDAKPITIEGTFRPRETGADLEDDIDAFILAHQGDERVLDIPHGSSTRRFIASAQNVIISRERGAASMASFSVEFIVPEGFGSDTTSLELLNTTVTTQSADLAMTVGGNYKAQPDITLTVNSVTGGDPSKAIRLDNPGTTEGLTITSNWAAGDVLVLNSRDRKVYLNNEQIYAVGAFPSWKPGLQQLAYSDDFTTRDVDIVATYTRRWS